MERYLCNLIVPGFPKSGTSSFHEYLDQHPDIAMSRPKECHYFARKDRWALGKPYHNGLFRHSDRIERWYGESSTIYCACDQAIQRIQEQLEAPRILLLLRHPVERAISHYRWLFGLGLEKRSLARAIAEDGDTFHPDHHSRGNYKGYLLFSRYSVLVPKWTDAFGYENVLSVDARQMKTSPQEALDSVCSFLNIPMLTCVENRNDNQSSNKISLVEYRSVASKLLNHLPTSVTNLGRKYEKVRNIWHFVSSRPLRPNNIPIPEIGDTERQRLAEALDQDVRFYEQSFKRAI